MAALRKLLLNLGPRALGVLGPMGYARLCVVMLRSLPDVARERDLKSVDRRMGRRVVSFKFMGRRVRIDCPAIDAIVKDGTYTFGLVRELGVRNCYLRNGVDRAIVDANWVVDLGANRGVFSAIAAGCGAKNILAVEGLPELKRAIETSMRAMRFAGCRVESAFVGALGDGTPPPGPTRSLAGLFDAHGIERVDVLKMDIEGGEYGLFKEPEWLDRVGALCMEVHPEHGRVDDVLERLTAAGFAWQCGDHMFRATPDHQQAEFIWAVRR
ncbi:MAG: FkbM family methyltransferase [Phycisphaerales bacterium]|nr:FkbM family methyltransferase [Phycisphaerales bacterium]